MDKTIKDRAAAKKAIMQSMANAARNAAIARNITLKFWPAGTMIANEFKEITERAIELKNRYENFPND